LGRAAGGRASQGQKGDGLGTRRGKGEKLGGRAAHFSFKEKGSVEKNAVFDVSRKDFLKKKGGN